MSGFGQSFAAKMAAARERAGLDKDVNEQPAQVDPRAQHAQHIAQQRILPASSNMSYFHATHKTLTILDQNEQKVKFEDHFLITDDPELANYLREAYCKKKTGSVQIREVNHFFYDQSTLLQPMIEPLPPVDPIFPPDPKPLHPELEKSVPETERAGQTGQVVTSSDSAEQKGTV